MVKLADTEDTEVAEIDGGHGAAVMERIVATREVEVEVTVGNTMDVGTGEATAGVIPEVVALLTIARR